MRGQLAIGLMDVVDWMGRCSWRSGAHRGASQTHADIDLTQLVSPRKASRLTQCVKPSSTTKMEKKQT